MIDDKIKSKVIGINVDTTTTAIAVVDLRGNILAQDYIPTQDYRLREYPFGRHVCTQCQLPDGLYRECSEYAVERYRTYCCYVA